ncbi:MAG: nuclear transport factor 2 family protein [Chiayiivirga sp.]|jgi:hypothetical protein|uniref:nuclear transport factor 2 family protein n=1 Tax=Chiayiivirga sp. TaxID=2041042 RepID=UPI0025C5BBAC|nr:nuclear transport factor 2 family protein [Chiayiivirga sp.]MCI1729821.1 nuclear transport factor 2 family protein [Chiayiivirga sp.]
MDLERRTKRYPAAWWMFGLCLALLAGCAREPAEQRLRGAIEQMQAAVLERRPGDFMQHVADDFVGNQGLDRAALHNLLRAQLLRNASVGATLGPLDVQLQGERATVKFSLVVTGGAGGLLPERAQGYAITSGWREVDGEWLLFLAEWSEAL